MLQAKEAFDGLRHPGRPGRSLRWAVHGQESAHVHHPERTWSFHPRSTFQVHPLSLSWLDTNPPNPEGFEQEDEPTNVEGLVR